MESERATITEANSNTSESARDCDLLSQKVEEQSELIKLVLTQIDVQSDKLAKHETLIENLFSQIRELQSRNNQTEKAVNEPKNGTDWVSTKENSSGGAGGLSIAEMAKQTAEETMASSGFVYDEASGLYLDYASGYYYDPVQSLYYNGHTGTYYTYDAEAQKYVYHSQAVVPNKSSTKKKSVVKKSARNKLMDEPKVVEIKEKELNKSKKSEHTRVKSTKNLEIVDDPHPDVHVSSPSKEVDLSAEVKVISDDDIEEGEISSSMGSPTSNQDYDSDCSTITSNASDSEPVAESFPPCIRAIVIETDVEDLKKGHLYIVTCTGGSIGSEGSQHSILISDNDIEKHHADIVYLEDDGGKYMIRDNGSHSGTFLDGKRLSEPSEQSELFEILHGSKLLIGNTSLLLHMHPGSFTCGHCEPGLLIEKEPQNHGGPILNKQKKEALRKKEMRKLQKKYGVGPVIPTKLSSLPESYQDRAQQRRVTKGSDNPYEKTEVASVDQALKESNKGFKMMSKMGWKEGTGLGSSKEDSIKEPIKMNVKFDRRGLGSASNSQQFLATSAIKAGSSKPLKAETGSVKSEGGDCRTKKSRAEILDKTFKRFKECANDEQK